MRHHHENKGALSPYRVLDLTEGGCLLGARSLGDLGADVIKIEHPCGSPSRIAPFYHDLPDPEKSLFWFAYCANKRGITLDIEKSDGRDLFRKLVLSADVVIESFEPGYLDSLGLGYSALSEIKPDIIMTSITPFGQNGPKAHYKAEDLVIWASSVFLYVNGDQDRAPLRAPFHQASLYGGAEGAVSTLMALYHHSINREGQFVDVSMQECMISALLRAVQVWDVNRVESMRYAGAVRNLQVPNRISLEADCKDGYIVCQLMGGYAHFIRSMAEIVNWMDEEGKAPEWLKSMDWGAGYDQITLTQDIIDRVEGEIKKFFKTKTQAEIWERANEKRILACPKYTTKDILESEQYKARGFWEQVAHPELDDTLTYCGASIKLSETPMTIRRKAPLIGEHNEDIYHGELGMSKERLIALKNIGVI